MKFTDVYWCFYGILKGNIDQKCKKIVFFPGKSGTEASRIFFLKIFFIFYFFKCWLCYELTVILNLKLASHENLEPANYQQSNTLCHSVQTVLIPSIFKWTSSFSHIPHFYRVITPSPIVVAIKIATIFDHSSKQKQLHPFLFYIKNFISSYDEVHTF